MAEEGESLVALLKADEMRWMLRERPLMMVIVVVVTLIELSVYHSWVELKRESEISSEGVNATARGVKFSFYILVLFTPPALTILPANTSPMNVTAASAISDVTS